MSARVPLSVLDLATVREGHTSADALRGTLDTAQAADDLGYTRFWVAEHHNMPAVASTSPPVLIAAVAARTARIRVGSGGVMLPNHMPFVVAEQFATLEALHPGRIDLGIGRAPGTDQATAAALRGVSPYLTVEQFPEHLQTLLGLLGDERIAPELTARLRATPAPTTYPEVWMLGSSTYGAQVAAALGLPFCYAYHFAVSSDVQAALHLYRTGFKPSPRYPKPYAMVSASVIAAETTEEAGYLAGPSRIMALSLRTGRLGPIISPEQAARVELSDLDRSLLDSLPGTQFAGSANEVVAGLDALVERTRADELILAGTVYDPATRQDTLARIAKAWGGKSRAPASPLTEDEPMAWQLTGDLAMFTTAAEDFLRSRPVQHTVMLTLIASLRRRGLLAYGTEQPIFGAWRDRYGVVTGALLQTPPFPMYFGEMPPEAVSAAVSALDQRMLTAANLPADAVDRFVEPWCAYTGTSSTVSMRSRLYRLGTLVPPVPPGMGRPARSDDRPRLITWMTDFFQDIGEPGQDAVGAVDDKLASGLITIWEADGEPTSMAARSTSEAGVVRIQYVYTPPVSRRRGYGGAVTALAAHQARQAGADEVVLFTDLGNATSNALYQRLGFRPIEDRTVVDFA